LFQVSRPPWASKTFWKKAGISFFATVGVVAFGVGSLHAFKINNANANV